MRAIIRGSLSLYNTHWHLIHSDIHNNVSPRVSTLRGSHEHWFTDNGTAWLWCNYGMTWHVTTHGDQWHGILVSSVTCCHHTMHYNLGTMTNYSGTRHCSLLKQIYKGIWNNVKDEENHENSLNESEDWGGLRITVTNVVMTMCCPWAGVTEQSVCPTN